MATSTLQPDLVIQIDFFDRTSKCLSIKVLNSKHTLFDIISTLFDYYLEDALDQKLSDNSYYITIHSSHFTGPAAIEHYGGGLSFPLGVHDCNKKKPVMLNTLNIQAHDTYKFTYHFGSVKEIILKVVDVRPPAPEELMMVDVVILSPDLKDILPFTAEEIAESHQYREKYESTKRRRYVYLSREQKYDLVDIPIPHYTKEEQSAMVMLINLGFRFADVWADFLEPALLNHKKKAIAGNLD